MEQDSASDWEEVVAAVVPGLDPVPVPVRALHRGRAHHLRLGPAALQVRVQMQARKRSHMRAPMQGLERGQGPGITREEDRVTEPVLDMEKDMGMAKVLVGEMVRAMVKGTVRDVDMARVTAAVEVATEEHTYIHIYISKNYMIITHIYIYIYKFLVCQLAILIYI